MRSGALAIAIVAALGCKDNTATPKSQPAGSPRSTQPTQEGERPALPQPEGVTGPGVVEVSRLSATVTLGQNDLLVDGVSLGHVRDGRVDRDKLDQLTRQLEGKVNSDDPVGIALDPTLPYLRVSELLASMRTAGFRNLALLTGTGKTMIPLELPDEAQLNAGNLRMVVTVRGGAVLLWSITGEEGTKDKPKVAVGAGAPLAPLSKALVEIVERRWPDGRRPAVDRTILVQVAPQETAARLLQVLALLRTEGRLELFPNVFLAAGA